MAANKEVASFDDMIQADRKRRKNEALANEMLGRGRKTSTPAIVLSGNRKAPAGPAASFASRAGIAKVGNDSHGLRVQNAEAASMKRSSSVTTRPSLQRHVLGRWSHDLHNASNARVARPALSTHNTSSALEGDRRTHGNLQSAQSANGTDSQFTVRDRTSGGMSIRGIAAPAGPFIVEASNFAEGTTAADIESAMAQTGEQIASCRLLSSHPTVIAQIEFVEKRGAETVIAKYNNQKADGRTLHVYMKQSGVGPAMAKRYLAPRVANAPNPDVDLMDVDETRPGREQTDKESREQLDRDRKRADAYYRDGRYGFPNGSNRNRMNGGPDGDRGGLYSDNLLRRNFRQ